MRPGAAPPRALSPQALLSRPPPPAPGPHQPVPSGPPRRAVTDEPPAMLWPLLLLVAPCLPQDYEPPRYTVSLELPPERRWEPVLRHYNSSEVREAIAFVFRTSLPKWVHAIIRPLAEAELAFLVREPYAGEIKGIARTLGVNIGDVVALNLCYEATAFCTSIIAQDDKGNVYHGRNLDYYFPDILRKLTMDLDFIQNGKVAYTGTTFLGYVGLWTGQRPYRFTISGDARERGEWWKNAISAFFKHSSPVSWLIRDALNNDNDFEAAALRLSKTPIIAETYYIIGGTQPKEGLVITRNRDGPADLWPLDPLRSEWFHVETNYDHWTTPPPSDDRRTPAIKALNATGQANINTDSLYKNGSIGRASRVIGSSPLLNARFTKSSQTDVCPASVLKTSIEGKLTTSHGPVSEASDEFHYCLYNRYECCNPGEVRNSDQK